MKILFITHRAFPEIGGVEKHIKAISHKLYALGHSVKTISESDIKYPHIRSIGLLYIWFWFFKNRKLIKEADVIHIHDVFIWYLPFRFIFPFKKVFTTFHGWEGKYPIPIWNLLNKRVACSLSNGTIAVGRYIEKFYKIKSNTIIYGGIENIKNISPKIKNTILFVGRLEPDTGLLQFLEWLKAYGIKLKASFVGDGSLRSSCEKFGKVHGFCDPIPFYKKTETIVPSGYLTYLEAKSYGCKIKTFYGNELKKEYWEEIKNLKKLDTWEAVANKYIKLWNKK